MRAYFGDLRRKIVEAVELGITKSQATRHFGISLSSVKLYLRAAGRGSHLLPEREADETT